MRAHSSLRCLCFDWGGTLMSEDGPLDRPMADWPAVSTLPGAHDALAALAPRFMLCVATNAAVSRKADIERALARVDLLRFISQIFCYAELGVKKRDPIFWDIVLKTLDLPPSAMLMVGDHLEEDVLPPRRAGLGACLFRPADAHDPATSATAPAPPPDVPILHDLRELLVLLDASAAPLAPGRSS